MVVMTNMGLLEKVMEGRHHGRNWLT